MSDPLHDSRFRTWAAGDCYIVYPDARSSIRFERLIEGIQNCEKVRILRRQHLSSKRQKQLEDALKPYSWDGLKATQASAAEMVRRLERVLNQ